MNKAIYFGFNPPFFGGAQNVLSRQEDERLIKNDILQLLRTIPGERVMRPTFGLGLRNLVFEQLVESDIDILQSEITQVIVDEEPRVIVDDVSIQLDNDRQLATIKIKMRLKKDIKRELMIEQVITTRA